MLLRSRRPRAAMALSLLGIATLWLASTPAIAGSLLRTLQSVPNSGVSREPFVLFELPAGRIAIEPMGTGADTRWKFTADTARTIRGLYRAAEQLPDNNALDPTFIPFSPMFALRALVKSHAPLLLNSLPRNDSFAL